MYGSYNSLRQNNEKLRSTFIVCSSDASSVMINHVHVFYQQIHEANQWFAVMSVSCLWNFNLCIAGLKLCLRSQGAITQSRTRFYRPWQKGRQEQCLYVSLGVFTIILFMWKCELKHYPCGFFKLMLIRLYQTRSGGSGPCGCPCWHGWYVPGGEDHSRYTVQALCGGGTARL